MRIATRRKEEIRTCISRWSDRQSSKELMSGMFGARTDERNFPPKIRVIGDSAKLAYRHIRALFITSVKPIVS